MKWIVGLGNPERRYDSTPHNLGFEVVDLLARRAASTWRAARRTRAELAEGRIAGVACRLVKPTTYMNLSGEAVGGLVRYDRTDVGNDLLVVLDDVALPLGRLRLRPGGSSGGHRGLQSVIAHVQTDRVPRLRLGCRVTQEPIEEDLADYVLSRWPKALRPQVDTMVAQAADAAQAWLTGSIEDVMSEYNR